MSARLPVIGLAILASAVAAHAQAPNDRTQPSASYIDPISGLTLGDAVRQALKREPSLRAVRSRIDIARGQEAQAALRPNPSVSFTQQQQPGGADNQTRVDVQWPLDLFRKTGRVEVATRETEVARQATSERERTLAGDVRLKYGDVAAAVQTLAVTEELLAATARQRDLVAARVDQGATPPLDRDMLRVESQRLEADRRVQVGEVERRLIELKRLLGLPPDAPLAIRQSLDQLVHSEVTPAPANGGTSEARPDIRQAQARVTVADAEIDRARREGRPDVSVFGMYMRMNFGFPQQGFSTTGSLEPVRDVFHDVAAGAMVTLPIRNQNQGAVAVAQAERTTAQAELEATTLTAHAEIAAARVSDERARQALEAYAGDVMSLAQKNLGVVRQTYELGRGTLLDVLTEQRRYLEVQRAYTDVLREAYEARERLKQAMGESR